MEIHFIFEGDRLAKLDYLIQLINFHSRDDIDENSVRCILADAVDEGLSGLINYAESILHNKEILDITKGGTLIRNELGWRTFIPEC